MSTTPSIYVGRRKNSVARVRLVSGTGKVTVNDREFDNYFVMDTHRKIVNQPLVLVGKQKDYDVLVNVYGGGVAGQAGAVRHAISRGLQTEDETLRAQLKKAGFLTRDSRKVERKKYGKAKARKSFQFSKR